jgi:basic membrane lipoprotein Med (substrate-binding protein (PBP1-ABC) superfamily)
MNVSRKQLLNLLVGVTLLSGCAQQEPSAPSTTDTGTPAAVTQNSVPPAPEGEFKIGLITPGMINDKGWSQLAYDTATKISGDLGAKLTPPVEAPAKAEIAGAIRNLAAQGNQLILLHGSEYDEDAATVAKDFPKTTFVVANGRTEAANVTPLQFAAGEATYLAGMVAAGMSKSGKVACVGGVEIPIVKAAFDSFAKGAKAVNPACEVKVTFTGGEDIVKAKQQTETLLSEGVDVVMHNANAGGQGVAQAIEGKEGALFIGANADQSDLVTPKNLGSFILDVPAGYVVIAGKVKEGKGDGKAYRLGLKDKAASFKYNDKFAGKIPDDLKAKVTQAEADIIAGKVTP